MNEIAAVVFVNEKAVDKWMTLFYVRTTTAKERERRYVDDYVLMETGETN